MSTLNDNKSNDIKLINEQPDIHTNGTPNTTNSLVIRVRAIKLETVRDVRKFLSRLINKTYRDEVSPAKAGRLGQLAGILLKTIELTDIERRISELEGKIRPHGEPPTPD